MVEQPRRHHMQMKYLLAQMALQDPKRFFATFGPTGDTAYLTDLWTAIGQGLPPAELVSSAGASAWHGSVGDGQELLVLILPPPAARNEAYFVGVVGLTDGRCRVFCLERSVTGPESTVLSELAAEGRSNWGAGTAPKIEEFATLLRRIVADPSARPLTFIPMQLV